MSSTVAIPTASASATPVQPQRTAAEGWTVVPDTELARLRALDDVVRRWTAASRAANPVVTSREMERGGVTATGQRVADLGRQIVSRSELRRLEIQMMALSDRRSDAGVRRG